MKRVYKVVLLACVSVFSMQPHRKMSSSPEEKLMYPVMESSPTTPAPEFPSSALPVVTTPLLPKTATLPAKAVLRPTVIQTSENELDLIRQKEQEIEENDMKFAGVMTCITTAWVAIVSLIIAL